MRVTESKPLMLLPCAAWHTMDVERFRGFNALYSRLLRMTDAELLAAWAEHERFFFQFPEPSICEKVRAARVGDVVRRAMAARFRELMERKLAGQRKRIASRKLNAEKRRWKEALAA